MPSIACFNRARRRALVVALVAAGLAACSPAHAPGVAAAGASAAAGPGASASSVVDAAGCLPGERGFLDARLTGALEAELQWRGAVLLCEGGARPDGRGLRASFAGPGAGAAAGHTLRFVFGLSAQPGAALSRNVPARLTVIAEGANRIYATQGDGQCMVESLVQERLPSSVPASPGEPGTTGASTAGTSLWRLAARGYCIDPAVTLDGAERLHVDRFDFAGAARFEDNELHENAD